MRKRITALLLLLLPLGVLAQTEPLPSIHQAGRPKIALVLSGGGAKGAAHIGVLKILEEKRIPVDIVVGTSMGSFVAGLYATGLSAQEVEQVTLSQKWNESYQDKVNRDELSLRQKQQDDRYQLTTDIGVGMDGVKSPAGFLQGQSMAKLLRNATNNLPMQKSFDDLPVPYRAVATDMGTVTPFILDQGSLAKAMQASMSIPGALKPIEWDGHILVDGGVVNNMPVDVAKSMGADIIIAVDIGAKLRPQEELTSGLKLVDQLTTYMTQSGTERQISLLGDKDILLSPSTGSVGIADFDRMPEVIVSGANTARYNYKLDKLSLSEADYQRYLEAKSARRKAAGASEQFYISKIKLKNNSSLSDETLEAAMQLKGKQVQSREMLEAGIRRIYALETFDRVTYEIEKEGDEQVLVIDANEKSWGPGYLDFQFGFEDDFQNSSNYSVGAAYTLTNINDWGGEWLIEGSLGTWKHFKTEIYSPLDPSQTFFGQANLAYDSQEHRLNNPNAGDSGVSLQYLDADYDTWSSDLMLGWNIKPWQRLMVGLYGINGSISIDEIGIEDLNSDGLNAYLRFQHDNLDSRYFPYSGTYLDMKAGYAWVAQEGDAISKNNSEGALYEFRLIKPWSSGRHSVNLLLEAAGTDTSEDIPVFARDLGGLFHLSGFQQHELSGRNSLFGGLRYIYRLADNNFGAVKAPIYVGGSIEQGGVWDSWNDISGDESYTAGSIYMGTETFLGPVFLGVGAGEGDRQTVYLQLGSTF